ncbi:MAG: hypothetical protein V1736_08885 [Pseudomonadota bacterium]
MKIERVEDIEAWQWHLSVREKCTDRRRNQNYLNKDEELKATNREP